MTLLYFDPIYLEHDTGHHPECARRLSDVWRHLSEDTTLAQRCTHRECPAVGGETLTRNHDRQYVKAVEEFAAHGGGRLEADTIVSPKSYDVALRAAGAACDAVQRVVGGEDTNALCLVRPPGHHALADRAMGFCLFNNVAIAARSAITELELNRVLIVDWDVHHGNGTQAAFWEDGQVGFFSVHRWPFYPGTGHRSETGAGKGLGWTRNLPVEFGTSRLEYQRAFAKELSEFAEQVRPQLVIVSAGFDSHREDPIGSLGLEEEDFEELTTVVMDVAASHAEGRLVSVLEGGYNTAVLARCVGLHLTEMLPGDG